MSKRPSKPAMGPEPSPTSSSLQALGGREPEGAAACVGRIEGYMSADEPGDPSALFGAKWTVGEEGAESRRKQRERGMRTRRIAVSRQAKSRDYVITGRERSSEWRAETDPGRQ